MILSEISKQQKMQQLTSMFTQDGVLKFDFMFSLQKIAMAKIVSNLWMNELNQAEKIDWEETTDIILAKVSQLFLPNYVSKQLQYIVVNFRDSIFGWIEYHDYILGIKDDDSTEDLISNITWTVRGRIDYVQTAKDILSSQDTCLNDDQKYKLACMYCLEDEIAILIRKIPVNQVYLSGIAIDQHPMVYFWTAHFTGDNTPFNNPKFYNETIQRDEHMSINEYIMLLLINDVSVFNDIPIRYMWNKLNEEEKTKHIITLVKNVADQDILFSILSNIQYNLQQNILKEYSDAVLCGTLQEWWWWGEYFLPAAHCTLDMTDPKSYWHILMYVYSASERHFDGEGMYIYDEFRSLFKQLWRESSKDFKEFFFQLDNGSQLEWLLKYLLYSKGNTDIFELILNDLSAQNKKKILSGENGVTICASLIEKDKQDLLELLLSDALFSEEEINQLKEKLIQVKGNETATHFLKTDVYDALKRFKSWAFKCKKEIWKVFKH